MAISKQDNRIETRSQIRDELAFRLFKIETGEARAAFSELSDAILKSYRDKANTQLCYIAKLSKEKRLPKWLK